MKKFTKFMVLLLIGGTTLFTSCVSEDISPEVENLRQAQANLINSKAEFESARAENQSAEAERVRAQAALIQAQAEFQIAQNALLQVQVDLQEAILQARTEAEIAALEAEVAEAQARMAAAQAAIAGSEAAAAEAEVRAAQAQVALEQALQALANLSTEAAQDYLDKYNAVMMVANGVKADIDDLNVKLARFEALRDENGNPVAFLELIADAQEEIADKQADIAMAQAEIARLEPLDGNADAAREELAQIEDELDVLESELASAELELNRFEVENDYNAVVDALADVNINLGQIAGFEAQISGLEGDIADQQDIIAGLESDIADIQNGDLARVQELLAPYEALIDELSQTNPAATDQALALLEAWRDTYVIWDTENIQDPGSSATAIAEINKNDARADFVAFVWLDADTGTNPDPYITGDSIANPIVQISGDDFAFNMVNSQYAVDLGADTSSLVENNDTYITLKAEESILLGQIGGFEGQIDTAEGIIDGLNDDIGDLESDITAEQNANAAIWASFGVANLAEHQAAVDALDALRDPLVDAVDAINDEVSSLQSIEMVLMNYLSGNPDVIAAQIHTLESNIAMWESHIEDAQQDIADGEFTQQEFEAMIVRVEAEVETLTVQYDAHIELANTYLELFFAAVAD